MFIIPSNIPCHSPVSSGKRIGNNAAMSIHSGILPAGASFTITLRGFSGTRPRYSARSFAQVKCQFKSFMY